MKKIVYLLAITIFTLAVYGCSGKAKEVKEKLEEPIEDAADYIPKEVELNKRMQGDIQNVVDKENERLQKILDEGNAEN